jgi:hypothetical protein
MAVIGGTGCAGGLGGSAPNAASWTTGLLAVNLDFEERFAYGIPSPTRYVESRLHPLSKVRGRVSCAAS